MYADVVKIFLLFSSRSSTLNEKVQATDFSITETEQKGTGWDGCRGNRTSLTELKRLPLRCMLITECWGGNGAYNLG